MTVTSVVEVETRAAWEAIRLLRQHFSEQQFWMEGDALSVIQDLIAAITP